MDEIKKAENKYTSSVLSLAGLTISPKQVNDFFKNKANLLLISIDSVNLPQGEARIVIEHYANKLTRVGEAITDNESRDKGDLVFLLDQLNSAKRILIKNNKDTSGLSNYLINLNRLLPGQNYIAKSEEK